MSRVTTMSECHTSGIEFSPLSSSVHLGFQCAWLKSWFVKPFHSALTEWNCAYCLPAKRVVHVGQAHAQHNNDCLQPRGIQQLTATLCEAMQRMPANFFTASESQATVETKKRPAVSARRIVLIPFPGREKPSAKVVKLHD